jgi:hypothetical protein
MLTVKIYMLPKAADYTFPRESAALWGSMAGALAKARVHIFTRGLQRAVSKNPEGMPFPGHSPL